MTTPINSIIRQVLPRNLLNIFVYPHDGYYERNLCLTGHNFYVNHYNLKNRPNNLYIFSDNPQYIPNYLDVDLVLLNNRLSHYERATILSNFMHVPTIIVDHHYPYKMKDYEINHIKVKTPANIVISSDKILKDIWKTESEIINYGVEPIRSEYKDDSILVYGHFQGQDYTILQYLKQNPNVIIKGNNPGISEDCDEEELIRLISKAKIYINLSTEHSINYNILRAMSAGCCIISNNMAVLSNVLNKHNSIICTKLTDFKEAIDNPKTTKLGQNAKGYAEEKYSMGKFIKEWSKTFERASKVIFRK